MTVNDENYGSSFVSIYNRMFFVCSNTKGTGKKCPVFWERVFFYHRKRCLSASEKDAYYTNGVFFSLLKADQKKAKKRIRNYQLGQMIFTPQSKRAGPNEVDRPYCGLLFLKYAETDFKRTIHGYSSMQL